MHVEEIMTKAPVSVRPGDSLATAAWRMWEADCGCLPVVADDGSERVVGVITDRDVCMAGCFQARPLADIPVEHAMSRDVRTCRPGDALADVESTLSDAHLRRLPVVDEAGRLLGIVSMADLAGEAARERNARRPEISEAEIGTTLARICEPRAA